jgi:hypothetical protein
MFRLSRGVAGVAGVASVASVEICVADFSTLRQLGWIDPPHTQNFEILKSLEQTQESKKFKISFEFL